MVHGAPGEVGRITTIGVVSEFPVPDVPPASGSSAGTPPILSAIAAGPDGALWFAVCAGEVGRITTSGDVTEFPVPDVPPAPNAPAGSTGTPPTLSAIVAGPDGALWFTGVPGEVGRITTSGAVTEFPVEGLTGSSPAIAVGPDGAIWVTGLGQELARITTSGAVTEFPEPGNYSTLAGLAAGPDGNVWFTEKEDGSDDGEQPAVGEITRSGTITTYPLPQGTTLDPNRGVDPYLGSITTGRDGDLWFLENSAVGRITTEGVIQQVPGTIPGMTGTTLQDLAVTSDGAAWFTATGDVGSDVETAFDRLSTSGAVRVHFLRSGSYASLSDLTPGRDGTLWFVDTTPSLTSQVSRIGRIMPRGSVEMFAIPVPKGETNQGPGAMALGPDGDIYFTGGYTGPKDKNTAGYIGRVTARGKVQILPLPAGLAPGGFTKDVGGGSYRLGVESLISGPGGQLWFDAAEGSVTGIARMSSDGKLGRFIPMDIGGNLVRGPEGRVYLQSGGPDGLSVTTRSGIVATYNLPGSTSDDANISSLAAGPDGNLWYTDGVSSIGRIGGLNSVAGGLSLRGRPRRPPDFVTAYGQGSWTNTTAEKRPTFAGVATPGAEVTLWVQQQGQDQPTAIGEVKADRVDGSWTLTSGVRLEDGTYAVTATQTGDTGPPDVLYSLTPDSDGNLSNALVIESAKGGKKTPKSS